jgi:hypothetical protein
MAMYSLRPGDVPAREDLEIGAGVAPAARADRGARIDDELARALVSLDVLADRSDLILDQYFMAVAVTTTTLGALHSAAWATGPKSRPAASPIQSGAVRSRSGCAMVGPTLTSSLPS